VIIKIDEAGKATARSRTWRAQVDDLRARVGGTPARVGGGSCVGADRGGSSKGQLFQRLEFFFGHCLPNRLEAGPGYRSPVREAFVMFSADAGRTVNQAAPF
jgi:hypothetical protein